MISTSFLSRDREKRLEDKGKTKGKIVVGKYGEHYVQH